MSLTPFFHADYLALSVDGMTRQQYYRTMVMDAVVAEDLDTIRRHLQRQHPYGTDRFTQTIEAQLG